VFAPVCYCSPLPRSAQVKPISAQQRTTPNRCERRAESNPTGAQTGALISTRRDPRAIGYGIAGVVEVRWEDDHEFEYLLKSDLMIVVRWCPSVSPWPS
jgi:hypothetical protein